MSAVALKHHHLWTSFQDMQNPNDNVSGMSPKLFIFWSLTYLFDVKCISPSLAQFQEEAHKVFLAQMAHLQELIAQIGQAHSQLNDFSSVLPCFRMKLGEMGRLNFTRMADVSTGSTVYGHAPSFYECVSLARSEEIAINDNKTASVILWTFDGGYVVKDGNNGTRVASVTSLNSSYYLYIPR